MCEFCTKHGEGKKWYLNVKNYSNDLLSDIRRRKLVKNVFYRIENIYKYHLKLLKLMSAKIPFLEHIKNKVAQKLFRYQHWGQIIPIEDVEKILSFSNPIVQIPCICRKVSTGKEVRTCFVTTLAPEKFGMIDVIDKSFFGGPDIKRFEKINNENVLKIMKEQEKHGMFHSVWTHGTPFIGGICCCDDTGCLGLATYKEKTQVFFRAEYVAIVDLDKCMGCQECIKVCNFQAVTFDGKIKKVNIDATKCYGCGVCRAVCKKNAISLLDRSAVPQAAHLW